MTKNKQRDPNDSFGFPDEPTLNDKADRSAFEPAPGTMSPPRCETKPGTDYSKNKIKGSIEPFVPERRLKKHYGLNEGIEGL